MKSPLCEAAGIVVLLLFLVVGCVGEREIGAEFAVELIIGVLQGGGAHGADDLADAFGSEGDVFVRYVMHQVDIDRGHLIGSEEAQCAEFLLRNTVFQVKAFGEGIAKTHGDAAFDLSFGALLIDDASGVGSRDDAGDLSFFVQHKQLGGKAVADVADRVRFVGGDGVGFKVVFTVEAGARKFFFRLAGIQGFF